MIMPEPTAEKHDRTVYLRFEVHISVEARQDEDVPGRTVYEARCVDYPQVSAEAVSPEGAMVACETRLNNWIKEKLKGEAKK